MKPEDYIKEALVSEMYDLEEIGERLDGPTIRLLHAALGLSTESAEVADLLKKHVFYGKELPAHKVIDECGDVLWYLAVALDTVGSNFEEAMEANNTKLKERFPTGFDAMKAIGKDVDKEYEKMFPRKGVEL